MGAEVDVDRVCDPILEEHEMEPDSSAVTPWTSDRLRVLKLRFKSGVRNDQMPQDGRTLLEEQTDPEDRVDIIPEPLIVQLGKLIHLEDLRLGCMRDTSSILGPFV